MTAIDERSLSEVTPQRTPLLEVEDLRIAFGHGQNRTEVVRGVTFSLAAGEVLAIVGESGSGKSVTARTIIGLPGAHASVTAKRLSFDGRDLLSLSGRGWRDLRGKGIGFVLQDALVSLDPLRPSGKEVGEALKIHRFGSRKARHERVLQVLRDVGVPDPETRARQRSGELSGGLRQRALIASGLVLDPPLLIADEPTTALDTTVQAQVISVLRDAKARGKALLLISHDLAVVGQIADHVIVMRNGEVVESGLAERVLTAPETDYTRSLLGAMPSARSRGRRLSVDASGVPATTALKAVSIDAEPVLELRNVSKTFNVPGGVRTKAAVIDVSFTLHRGETLGVVGESGCGKTTASRIALALVTPDSGEAFLDGEPWSALPERERRVRRRRITAVYQDPLGSFDPRWSVGAILRDAVPHDESGGGRKAVARRAIELLDAVGLPASYAERRPLNLSGGQRQRVAIARAIASRPEIIVLDEPVSALDVSIQAQVLDLFADLQQEFGLSYLFISHDLGVISHLSDRIVVMKDGRVVETGSVDAVFNHPQHDYTKALLSAVPRLRGGED